MKRFTKVLVLGALAIGAITGCDFGKKDSKSASEVPSSQASSISSSSLESIINSSAKPSSSSSSAQSSSAKTSSSASSSSSIAPTLTGIALNTDNVKKEYEQGEALDLTGLKVIAAYNNNTTSEVQGYSSNPQQGTVLETIGEQNVVITYQTFTQQFTVNVVKAVKRAWTTEEAKVMSDNLYGTVLPFTGYEESVVSYDATKEIVTIAGGKDEGNYVKAYADLLPNYGFALYGAAEDESAFGYKKSVQTTDGNRFVFVNVTSNTDGLYITSFDPYFYTYPSVFANYFAYLIGTEEIAPAFVGADYYEVNENDAAVYCYMNSTTDDCGYSDTLRAANWKVAAEKNAEGYYVAIAPDYSYELNFIYQQAQGRFAIIFKMVTAWQADFFTEFFAKQAHAFDVPAFEAEGATFLFMESGNNALVGIYGIKLADIQAYAVTVKEAGWKVTRSSDGTFFQARLTIENVGIALMSFGFDPQYNSGTIVVNGVLEPLPGTVFPSAEIAKMLGSFVTDTVPVYQGEATGYSAYKSGSNFCIRIEIEEGTEADAREAYIHTILANGYDLETGFTYTYVSPNRQIYLQASGIAGSGALIITVWHVLEITETWPGEVIATIMGADVIDVLPAYIDADYFEVSPEGNGEMNVWITLPDDTDGEDAVEAYIAILEENGYAWAYDDEDEDPHYITVNGQIDVCPWTNGGDLNLYIRYPETTIEWPGEFVQDFFDELGFEDELPEYEGEFNRINYGLLIDVIYINVRLDESDEPEPSDIVAAFDGYCATLEENEFVFVKEDVIYGDQVYNSPNGEFSVTVSGRTYGIRIEIAGPESVEASSDFPMEEIIECIPEVENVLPAIASAEGIAFHTEGGIPGYIDVYAVYDDTNALEDAYDAYIAALEEAEFEAGDYYGDTVYYSPNHDFYVMVDYDASYGLWIGIGSVGA